MTCTCGTIQASDPTRHFKGCPERVERMVDVTIGPVMNQAGWELLNQKLDEHGSLTREVIVLREQLRKSLNREKLLNDNLTICQTENTQLVEGLRVANGLLRNLSGCIILKGWTCGNQACRVFNGEEKEPRTHCRSCDAEKPET